MDFRTVSLDQLTIDDERSVAHVAIYDRLKQALRRSGHRFQIPAAGGELSWDRALFLNLTYWSGATGTDVLCDDHIPADVVAHVAWHAVVSRQLAVAAAAGAPGGAVPDAPPAAESDPPSAAAIFFSESIASAFDLYLVGRLLNHAPDSDFIVTQVPQMAERAEAAGMPDDDFARLIDEVARDPERAFEDLRALLFDAAHALLSCRDALAAQAALERFAAHRFAPLLHHFELSNWILYARAYANRGAPHGINGGAAAVDAKVEAMDRALRAAPVALELLADRWID